MNPDDSLLRDFLRERDEVLDEIESEILELERCVDGGEVLRGLFRSVHSLKGTFGLLGFGSLEAVWQDAETMLEDVRNCSVPFSKAKGDDLLGLVDRTRAYFDDVDGPGRSRIEDCGPWSAGGLER